MVAPFRTFSEYSLGISPEAVPFAVIRKDYGAFRVDTSDHEDARISFSVDLDDPFFLEKALGILNVVMYERVDRPCWLVFPGCSSVPVSQSADALWAILTHVHEN